MGAPAVPGRSRLRATAKQAQNASFWTLLNRCCRGYDLLTKRGFVHAFASWLRGPLNEVLHDSLSKIVSGVGACLNQRREPP